MRVIITGGTGLVGKALSQEMRDHGYEVVVLSRSPSKRASEMPDGVQIVAWDAKSAEGWGNLADGARAIVNLAGENLAGEGFFPKRWTPARKALIRDSRRQSGQAVLEAVKAAQQKPEVVIQASAVGHYGPSGDEIITEADPPADDFLAQVTVDWEASSQPVKDIGVRHVVIRSAGILLSKDSGALPRLVFPYRLFSGVIFGDGRQWYTWIHPADEAAAIRFLIEQDQAQGAFNLMAPNPVRHREFARILGQVMNRPAWLPAPSFAVRLAFGEVADVILTGQRAMPARLQEGGFNFRFPDLATALDDILG